jgi:starch synthase
LVSSVKALFLAAEATPFIKVGGLADVAGELPPALRALGVDIRLALPAHGDIDRSGFDPAVRRFPVPGLEQEGQAELVRLPTARVETWLLDGRPIRAYPQVYGDPAAEGDKYVFAALAALQACESLGWYPDVIHANDWHCAAALARLKAMRRSSPAWKNTASLCTIHNLPFMGTGAEEALRAASIPPADDLRLPVWARWLPLPIGMAAADRISTVSPSYALEIQTREYGCGLEAYLSARASDLSGILNGIDPGAWNPATDTALAQRFESERPGRRAANRYALQVQVGLKAKENIPLIGMVTRMDHQKGIDLALQALAQLGDTPFQFILLGSGDPELEAQARDFAGARPGQAAFVNRFAADLARLIYGGADMVLVPSRYEPCGLAQMIAMRYGSVPIVRATGGLKDSVKDADADALGTGFVFGAPSTGALFAAVGRALIAYAAHDRWVGIQQRAMRSDFSWQASSRQYLELYQELIGQA